MYVCFNYIEHVTTVVYFEEIIRSSLSIGRRLSNKAFEMELIVENRPI